MDHTYTSETAHPWKMDVKYYYQQYINDGLYSSATCEWATPLEFYNRLNTEFRFTLDPCATEHNAKCKRFYTIAQDRLSKSWDGERVFMNPPYGFEISHWVKKASEARGGLVVCLLPARTDTRWFHQHIYGKAEIRFVKGRIKFGGGYNSAPFPSMLAIFQSVALSGAEHPRSLAVLTPAGRFVSASAAARHYIASPARLLHTEHAITSKAGGMSGILPSSMMRGHWFFLRGRRKEMQGELSIADF